MAKSLDAKTVEKAAKKVLKKASGELMKLSKVQAKVRERLFKDNPHITEQETHQLLAEVLQTSRSFAVDGKKVRLAAEPVPVAAATDVKAETVAALVRDDKVDHKRKRVEADEQQQTQGKQKKHKHKHLKQEEARLQQAHQQDEQAASQQQQPVPDKAPGSSQQQQLQQQEPEQKKHKHKGKDKHKDKKHKEIKVESQGTLVTAAHNTQQDTQQQQQQPEPSKHKKHGKDERNHNKHKVIKIESQGTPATADNNTQQQSEPDQLKNHGKEKHRDKHKHKAIKAEVMGSPSVADGTAKQEKQQQQQLPQSKDKDKQKTKVPHAVSQSMPLSDQLEKPQQQQQQQLTTPRAAGPRDKLQQTTPGPLLSKPQALKAITPAKQQQQQRVSTPAAAEGTARANLLQTVQALQQRKPAGVRHTVLTPAAAAPDCGVTAAAAAAVQAKRASQLKEIDDEVQRQTRARRSDTWRVDYNRTDVKHGKFTDAEKEAIHEAIVEFADEKGLPHDKGECGWLVDRKTADLKRGVITAIAAAVPHRTRKAVWQFVQSNYTPIEVEGPFSPEEDEKLLQLFEELGPRWKEIGQRMGRLDRTVRDRAKTLNYGKDKNRGRWSQEEIDMLSSLVSAYSQALATAAGAGDEADDGEANGDADAAEGGDTAAGAGSSSDVRRISKLLLPDEHTEPRPVGNVTNHDVDWEWVSSQMEARTAKQCAERWHHIQSPGMIESGQWAPGNDSTMVAALAAAAPQEEFQVDWGKLVPGRNAQQCKRRWKLILRHLPVEVRNNFSAAVAEAANRMQRKQKKKSKAGNRTEGDADGGGGEPEAAAGQ